MFTFQFYSFMLYLHLSLDLKQSALNRKSREERKNKVLFWLIEVKLIHSVWLEMFLKWYALCTAIFARSLCCEPFSVRVLLIMLILMLSNFFVPFPWISSGKAVIILLRKDQNKMLMKSLEIFKLMDNAFWL